MLSDDLIGFLKKNFPEHLSEIGVALDLFIYSLNNAGEAITVRGNELSKSKDFEDAIDFLKRASEVYDIAEHIQTLIDSNQLNEIAFVSEDEKLKVIENNYPNYEIYEVDTNIAHTLYEDFIHKRPCAFMLKNKKVCVTEWTKVLIETCNQLYEIDKSLIRKFPDEPKLNGRKSKYFTFDTPELLRAPKKLNDLDFYVETHFSANDIRNLIIKMLNYYKIPLSEYRIYLRADYNKLQGKEDGIEDLRGAVTLDGFENKHKPQKKAPDDFTEQCIKHVEKYLNVHTTKISKAKYTTSDNRLRIVCLISSERDTSRNPYFWFGFRSKQKDYLEGVEKSYVALGCGSENLILLIPYSKFSEWLADMSVTAAANDIKHWHVIVMKEKGNLMLRRKLDRNKVNISEFIIPTR